MSIALFVLTCAFIAVRTGRDSLYFQGDSLHRLPLAYIAIALLSIPQAMLVLGMLRRFGGRATRLLGLGSVAGLIAGFYIIAEPGDGPAMTALFILVPLVFSVLFSMTWLLGSELLEHASRSEVAASFSRFGASSIAGGVTGGLLARSLGPVIGGAALLLVGAGLLAVTFFVVLAVHRRFPLEALDTNSDRAKIAELSEAESVAPEKVTHQPNFGLLLGISMAAAVTAILIDFQFYLAAASSPRDARELTVFFANVYLVLQGISLVLQLLVTPRLQRWIGLRGSLLVLPAALTGGAALLAVMSTPMVRAGLRITEGGLKAGVHRSVWEQAFLLFAKPVRARAKVLIDGLGAHVAEGFAAVGLYLWLSFAAGESSALWLTVTMVGGGVLWLALTRSLGRRIADQDIADDGEPWRVPLPDS